MGLFLVRISPYLRRDLLRKSPLYLARLRGNTDQKKLRIWTPLFIFQCSAAFPVKYSKLLKKMETLLCKSPYLIRIREKKTSIQKKQLCNWTLSTQCPLLTNERVIWTVFKCSKLWHLLLQVLLKFYYKTVIEFFFYSAEICFIERYLLLRDFGLNCNWCRFPKEMH